MALNFKTFDTIEVYKIFILFYFIYMEKFTIEGEKELQIGRIANEKYQYLEAFTLSLIEI